MDGGIFVNLFEIQIPESLEVYSQPWDDTSTQEISARMYPVNVYGDNTSQKLFAYGDTGLEKDVYEKEGFEPDTVTTQQNPQFVGRFAVDAVTHFLQNQGFILAKRVYTSYKRELVNVNEPLQTFYGSLDIYQAYNVQVMYLNFDGILKYFLVVTPKLRHEFVIPLERIINKVDCTGRFVKLTCPAECDVYACKLHEWRGKIAGRFSGFTDQGFYCQYLSTQEGPKSHVALSDARLDFDIPAQVCHLEASLSNIRFVFEGVYDKNKVNELIARIRVLSGDLLQRGRRVNLEVGRKRYEDCLSFVQRLANFEAFGVQLRVDPEPLRAIEGVPLPEQDYGFAIEEEEDDLEDIPF